MVLSFLPSHPDIIYAVSIIMLQLGLHNIFCKCPLLHGCELSKTPLGQNFFHLGLSSEAKFFVTINDDFRDIFEVT